MTTKIETKTLAQGAEILNVKQLYATNFIKAALGPDKSHYNDPWFCRPDCVVSIWRAIMADGMSDLNTMFARWLEISLAESISHPSCNYEWCSKEIKRLATNICKANPLVGTEYMELVKKFMDKLYDIEPDDYWYTGWPQDQVGDIHEVNRVDAKYLKGRGMKLF